MDTHTRIIEIELTRKDESGGKIFSAVLSTENPVTRKDWERGEFREVLSHEKNAVDLSRAPFPLLESHDARSLPIGVVDNIRVVDKKLKGTVRFGTTARAKEIEADVDAGIIRNLSIGYSISEVAEKLTGDVKTVTATKWMPHEVSAVAIGADSGAGFFRGYTMKPEIKTNAEPETTHNRAAEERERCMAITRIAGTLKLGIRMAEEIINSGATVDQARAKLFDEFEKRSEIIIPDTGNRPFMESRNVDDFRQAASDALLLRSGVRLKNQHPAARDINASVSDLARICISRAGVTVNGGPEKLIKRAMTTSDFSYILADATHRATLMGYEDEPSSHRAWVRTVPVRDFREQNRAILGSAPSLDAVAEHGEYKEGSLQDDGTSYTVSKFGKIISLSWEALVNDDLGSFLRIQPAMGQAARRKEADLVYAMFAENSGAGPTMQDGNPLFDLSNHANVTTAAGGVSAANLANARSLLRKQTALGGGYMALSPRFLIVPAEHETAAEILLASATKHLATSTEADTPKWLSGLELVVEPRLDEAAFFLAADSSQVDTAELGLLEENMQGPTLEEEREFGKDVYSWKVRHVFGSKFLDWRGIVKCRLS